MNTMLLAVASIMLAQAEGPSPVNLRCEWEVHPQAVGDPCPEFYWEVPSQSAFRIMVASSQDGFDHPWWDLKKDGKLPIVEYAGPPLENRRTYFWKVQVWNAEGKRYASAPVQRFALDVRPMPQHLPTVRTFVNLADDANWAKDRIDVALGSSAKEGRPDMLSLQYALVCTMVVPSKKADDLTAFCRQRGLELEDCFCHFAQDTDVTLHVGAELASKPREKRLCPGWDVRNDRNGDGWVDDVELASPINPKATARRRSQSRIPIYYWGPPRDDFVMNVGHPGYRKFMVEVHGPEVARDCSGIFFDTVPSDVPTAGRKNPVVEYPRRGPDADQWMRDLQILFAQMKIGMPGKRIVGNCWSARPMVLDGFEAEGWHSITRPLARWQRDVDEMIACDRRGKLQLLQYNPIHDPRLAEFGPKVPGVGRERDQLYGLATHLMGKGDFTYFGFGVHPYGRLSVERWFAAIAGDLGEPRGAYYRMHQDRSPSAAEPPTVFARPYSKGLVLIRPYAGGSYGDETSISIELPETLRPLEANGNLSQATTRIALRNGEAAILRRP